VTDEAASLTDEAADDMADPAESVAEVVVLLREEVPDFADPITRSFTLVTEPLARSTRRATTLDGLTFSLRASTS